MKERYFNLEHSVRHCFITETFGGRILVSHEFGNINTWTKDKLVRVRAYLDAYVTALKKQHFRLAYIDAFAGNGYVTKSVKTPARSLFDNEGEISLALFIDGSARLALMVEPSFQSYIFIEKSKKRCAELELLKEEFGLLRDKIRIVNGDANQAIVELCSRNWIASNSRAVMFVDPYGTQLDWTTIESIANTRAIDVWILFPIGAINRLLNRDGKIITSRRLRLNRFFGIETWFEEFFEPVKNASLSFVEEQSYQKKGNFQSIANFYLKRLKGVFPGVASNPLVLTNSTNSPIFVLFFASANPNGAQIAVRIAEHILKPKF